MTARKQRSDASKAVADERSVAPSELARGHQVVHQPDEGLGGSAANGRAAEPDGDRAGYRVGRRSSADDRISWRLVLPAFIAIIVLGAALGMLARSVVDAIYLVSRLLLGAAVVLILAAAVQFARNRGRARRGMAVAGGANVPAVAGGANVPAVAARSAVDVPAIVPTPGLAPSTAVGSVSPNSTAPHLDVAAAARADASRSAPVTPAAVAAAPASAPAGVAPSIGVPVAATIGDGPSVARTEILDAIAPYAEVVGRPVYHDETPEGPKVAVDERPASTQTVSPASVPPPPPARAVVPPPPPPVAAPPPPPKVVAPPPPAPAPPPVAPAAAPAAAPATSAAPTPDAPTPAAPTPIAPTPIAPPSTPRAPGAPVAAPAAAAVAAPPVSAPVVPPVPAPGEPATSVSAAAGEALVPSANVPGWSRSTVIPAARANPAPERSGAELAARSAVGSVAPVIVYRYRKWVLGQMVPGAPFEAVAVDRSPDEWLLLSTCGVATLMAWTHEDHHFTYPVETWADEILPAHGVRIRDRDLAIDLLLAAALHAGGIDSVPTERLRRYQASDLVTAMASIHVGLLRLYCGLGRIGPERVLADQYGIGPGDIPLH